MPRPRETNLPTPFTQQYLEIRQRAEKLSAQMAPNHPCRRGNGMCCEQRDITVTAGDADIMFTAALERGISNNTIERAATTARNARETYCPFFNQRSRECTIYPYRPLSCITYGLGGFPETRALLDDAEQAATTSGEAASIPVEKCIRMPICYTCGEIRSQRGDRIPVAEMEAVYPINNYVEDMKKDGYAVRIDEFALELPSLVKKR